MDSETFNKCIQTGSLHFKDPWRKFTHFSIVGFLSVLPCVILILHLVSSNATFRTREIMFVAIPAILSVIFYFVQKSRLKFQIIETDLNKEQLNKIVSDVAEELKWVTISTRPYCYEAKTFPGFFSGSWGEHITVLFHNNSVLINSICDPDKKSSLVSFRRNHKNTQTLKNKILDANNITPSIV